MATHLLISFLVIIFNFEFSNGIRTLEERSLNSLPIANTSLLLLKAYSIAKIMTTQDPKNKSKLERFLQFMKKIFIWSAILFVAEIVVKKVVTSAGWGWDKETWSKFEKATNSFDSVVLYKMQKLSPLSLINDLRSERGVSNIDTAARNEVDRYNSQNMLRIFRGEQALMPVEKYYHPEYHKVTVWEKVKDWGRGFWYNNDNSSYWFGRIILFSALLLAIPLQRTAKQNRKPAPLSSTFYLPNILLALLYLTFSFLLLFLFMKFILFIAGSLVALFSTLAAAGGFIGHLVEEFKLEMTDHFKKKIGP